MKIITLFSVLLTSALIWPSVSMADIAPPAHNTVSEAHSGSVTARKAIVRKVLPKQKLVAYGGNYKAGNWYSWGWCTYYVAQKRGGVGWSGNAGEWLTNAKNAKYKTGNKPIIGAILVENIGYWGHVAYVEKVYKDGSFKISEMNYKGFGIVSSRHKKVDKSVVGFIY